MDLRPLYRAIPRMDVTDPRRTMAATASPLCLAMHLDGDIEPYDHMVYLDEHVVSLCNMQLYPDGPGPPPEVWGRRREGKGSWRYLGSGYEVAISDNAFRHQELTFLRPGSMAEESDPLKVPNEDRVVLKLAIAMPPRHGKSLLVTETLPLWYLLRHPDNVAVVSTYNATFAQKWGQNLQDKMKSVGDRLPPATDGEYLTPLTATQDQMSFRPGKDRGEVNFRGFGGTLTGTGWGLGIIDDPFKDQADAMSETIRSDKKDWYSSTFSNRRTRRKGSPPPLEVMMFTRWHEDDLAGAFAYEEDGETPKDGWCVLRLPAIAEQGDPIGREPGQSLCPELAPLSFLLEEQRKNQTWFSCMFQGRPTHETGSMFAKTRVMPDGTHRYHHYTDTGDDFVYLDSALSKKELLTFITLDTATSLKKSADWTVAALWGWDTKTRTMVLIDRKRERVSSESHLSWLKEFHGRHSRYQIAFIGIEDKTFGTALINQLRSDAPELLIVPLPAKGDKVARATPYSEAVKAGKVWFPDPAACSWSVTWENEHVKFPKAKHDDQVDTGAMAWTKMLDYSYTPLEEEIEKKPDTPHERAKRHFRQRRSAGVHDYQQLLDWIDQ